MAGSVTAGKAYVIIQALDRTASGIASANAKVKSFSRSISSVGDQAASQGMALAGSMASLFVAPIAGLAYYADLDRQVRTVQSKMKGTASDVREIEKEIRRLGATTSWTTRQVGDTAVAISAMGLGSKAKTILAPVMNLALATGSDAPQDVAYTLFNAMNALQIPLEQAGQYADILTTAVNGSALTVQEFNESLKPAIGYARDANFSMGEVAAGLMAMANSGIKGSSAGTAMRNFIQRLGTRVKTFEKYGIELFDDQGSYLDFAQIVSNIKSRISDMSSLEKTQFFHKAFGAYGSAGIKAMLNSPDLEKFLSVLENCTDEAEKTAAHMQSGIWGTIKRIESAAYDLGLAFGEVFALPLYNAEQIITGILGKLSSMIQSSKAWIRALYAGFGVLMGIGAVLMGIGIALKIAGFAIGLMSTGLLLFKGILIGVTAIAGALNFLLASASAMLLFMISPLGLALAAVGAMIALFVDFDGLVSQTFGGILTFITKGHLKDAWELLVLGMKAIWLDFCTSIGLVFGEVIKKVLSVWVGAQNAVYGLLGDTESQNQNNQWLKEFNTTLDSVITADYQANLDRQAKLKEKLQEANEADAIPLADLANLDDTTVKLPEATNKMAEAVQESLKGGAGAIAQMTTALKGTESFMHTFQSNLANARGEGVEEELLDTNKAMLDVMTDMRDGLQDEGIIGL